MKIYGRSNQDFIEPKISVGGSINNSGRVFLKDRLKATMDPEECVLFSSVYNEYLLWCDDQSFAPVSRVSLGKSMSKIGLGSAVVNVSGLSPRAQRVQVGWRWKDS